MRGRVQNGGTPHAIGSPTSPNVLVSWVGPPSFHRLLSVFLSVCIIAYLSVKINIPWFPGNFIWQLCFLLHVTGEHNQRSMHFIIWLQEGLWCCSPPKTSGKAETASFASSDCDLAVQLYFTKHQQTFVVNGASSLSITGISGTNNHQLENVNAWACCPLLLSWSIHIESICG